MDEKTDILQIPPYGDYHTHTVFSHGKGSIEDNVLAAAKKGLHEIGITDHGFNHMTFNVRRKDISRMRAEIQKLAVKYGGVKVYLGVEANILSRKGNIDVRDEDKPALDLIVCGYHKLVWHAPAAFRYFWANNLGLSGKATAVRNTDAYVNAIQRNEIDILSHPGNFCACDIRAVAAACKQFGTYFELNGKRMYITDEQLATAAQEGCMFICDSDAHTPQRVGDIAGSVAAIERVGIPLSQVANLGAKPNFRSRKRGSADGGGA